MFKSSSTTLELQSYFQETNQNSNVTMTIVFLYYPPLLLISFAISFFPTLMTFCKKRVHPFMAIAPYFDHPHNTKNNLNGTPAFKCHDPNPFCSAVGGFKGNAATAGDDGGKKPDNDVNAVESATILAEVPKADLGRIGFFDDIGGGVDGLMSCTESVGFENSDEKRFVDDEMGDTTMSTSTRGDCKQDVYGWRRCRSGSERRRWSKVERGVKKFPPPLSSLNINGQPRFFLQPVRKDGKLQLTEVRVQRTEVVRAASRQDGRLRLHLVKDEDTLDFLHQHQQSEEQVEEEEEEEKEEEEEEEKVHDEQEIEKEEEKKEGEIDEEENKEEEQEREERDDGDDEEEEEEVDGIDQIRRVEEWKFPVSDKGFSRCYGLDHHLHITTTKAGTIHMINTIVIITTISLRGDNIF